MPELAEVRTVAKTLNERIVGKKIESVEIIYPAIILGDKEEFKRVVNNQIVKCVSNYGKWLFLSLGEYTIMSHLRMEGKYFIKDKNEPHEKHEHIIFHFTDGSDLRYHDTRKFGRMRLIKTNEIYKSEEISKLGIEPDNKALSKEYLYNAIHNKKTPIKTVLLDQSIINGLGNIYVDEVLFLSQVHPLTEANKVTLEECEKLVTNSKNIIEKATEMGGTTIRSYTSSLNVYGQYQSELKVHTKEKTPCLVCGSTIEKVRVGGRGSYFCPACQRQK